MRELIEPEYKDISIARQCELLDFPISTYHYKPFAVSDDKVNLMNRVDEIYTKFPCYGSRRISQQMQRDGVQIGRKKARTLMRLMKIEAIYQKPNTSKANPEHKTYKYLLKGLDINRPNQVWCTDITYIRLNTGWAYLMAVMDWYSRKVISWKVSNTMDTSFCTEVLEDALKYGHKPEIFNTDQGSQFTSLEFTSILKREGIRISMDGKGRCFDNIFIERLWRTVKYEYVYLNDYGNLGDLATGISGFFKEYNEERIHQSLKYATPDEIWRQSA